MLTERKDIRNVAIIAHVDHGKTTLIDSMLKQAKIFRANQKVQERIMDSNDLERERGITILAKNTAITIPNPKTGELVKINIVDTPGHADFGGEVERIMNMVDGVLLLVDAAEGPKPQTRFVLKQAIAKNLRTIVVINKLDRKDADADRSLNGTFDLFVELGASDEMTEFPIIYANGLEGKAGLTSELDEDLHVLFECILDSVPGPKVDIDAPFQMLVTNLGYDEYSGVTASGRIHAGTLNNGQNLMRIKHDGSMEKIQARYVFEYQGLDKVPVQTVEAGEINTTLLKVIKEEVSGTFSNEMLSRILEKLILEQIANPDTEFIVVLTPEELTALDGFLTKLQEKIKKGISLRQFRQFNRGFVISYDDGKSFFSFSDDALGEAIMTYLKPRMAAIFRESHYSEQAAV